MTAISPADTDGYGRIRIETPALAATVRTAPETVVVAPAAVPILWPADDAPTVRVLTVDNVAAPLDPTPPHQLRRSRHPEQRHRVLRSRSR